jgi:RNA polymerase sigma factor (sigma-70 family)
MIAIASTLKLISRPANLTGSDDHLLVQMCLDGVAAAWDTLVERYRKLVYSIPVQLGLGEADADDVFQSVFLTLHRFLRTLRDRTRLSAWLITTTRRECYRLIKRRRRDGAFPLEVFETAGESVDQQTERWETQQTVRRALEKLGDRDRRLVSMLFLDQGSPNYEAIAAEMGMRIGSIGPTRARILAKLQRILEEMAMGDEASLTFS